MPAVSAPKWVVYGFAVALIVGALAVRALLFPQIDGGSVYLFLLPVVLVVSALGGPVPGCVATGLIVAIESWVSVNGLSQTSIVDATAFLAVGFGLAWLGDRVRRARHAVATWSRARRT